MHKCLSKVLSMAIKAYQCKSTESCHAADLRALACRDRYAWSKSFFLCLACNIDDQDVHAEAGIHAETYVLVLGFYMHPAHEIKFLR
jgi:hypothetical protein